MSRKRLTWEEVRMDAKVLHDLELGNSMGAASRPLSAADILTLNIPHTPFLLENVFREKELAILSGARKTCKSFFLLDVLITLASGGRICDRIYANGKHKVVLIDAELSLQNIAERIRKVGGLHDNLSGWTKLFEIVCLKEEGKSINLSTEADQQWLDERIGTAKIVAFDNLGKLITPGCETCGKTWRRITRWFDKMQQRGITILLVHHENKKGQIRGTLKIEDDADLLISLKRPKSCEPNDGNLIEVHLPAARHLHGDQLEPFTIMYSEGTDGFVRQVGADEREIDLPAQSNKPVVTSREISAWDLTELQIDMLTIARTQDRVVAGDVIQEKVRGRSKSTVSNSFTHLCRQGLLERHGDTLRKTYYTPVAEQLA